MRNDSILRRIRRIGGLLNRREAALWLTAGLAATACLLWLLGLIDIFFRFARIGRIAAWLLLLVLVGLAAVRIARLLARKRTDEALATIIECSFPELDNRLINYLQFSANTGDDPFRKAYVAEGVPELKRVDPARMTNRKSWKRAFAALGVAVFLLLAPLGFMGRRWSVALWRVVNPFSNCRPVSLTTILAVKPGDTSVRRGDPLTLKCTVRGRKGHRVWLDTESSDGTHTTYDLGRLTSGDRLEFPHRVAAVNSDLRYRFRAGDEPFPKWHAVTTRPPLAFSAVALTVTPPAYTRLRPRTFDGVSDTVEVPLGSRIDIALQCNMPATSAEMTLRDAPPLPLATTGDPAAWKGTLTTNPGPAVVFAAANAHGERAEVTVHAVTLPDKPPTIRITSPKGRTLLTPGLFPAVEFTALDDYGVATVKVERVAVGAAKGAQAAQVAAWPGAGQRRIDRNWKSKQAHTESAASLAFRVVVSDSCPFADHTTRSKVILFDSIAMDKAEEAEDARDAKVISLLNKIIDLQRVNLHFTRQLSLAVDVSTTEHWTQAADKQTEIRKLTHDLLAVPREPLGGLATVVKDLYMDEMLEVITKLGRIPRAEPVEKPKLVDKSVLLEERILRQLTAANVAVARSTHRRRVAGLLSMLEALVKGETTVVTGTRKCIEQSTAAGAALVEEQDNLAGDVSDFVKTCRRESMALEAHDKKFAALVLKVADVCEAAKIRPSMLLAAEHLEKNETKQALPIEEAVLAGLLKLRDLLDQWQAAEVEQYAKDMAETLEETKEKLAKIRKLQAAVVDAMRLAETQKDRSDEERDMFEEEIEEMEKNIREALLEIPRDLHIFPELSVANELVEDVYSVFEEVTQLEDSEYMTAADAEEWGVLKPEMLLEQMAKAEGRIDDMEMWLAEKPDFIKFNMEAFDREEMPQMALGALPTAIEDIIGDLLKESPELAEAADDSATNQGMPEPPPPGWEVAEGPIESFGAQGKSGNQVPDHKEQSGRSIVGRQGQAFGETAAGSGTISEGDKNLEKRITPDPLQSGQIQVDGDADEVATGGGKQGSGAADSQGMSGAGSNRRMDSAAQGSVKGLEALMARTQSIHTKASLMHMRTESLSAAAHHMRQANDAIAAGLPIRQVREHQRRAVTALRQAKTELAAGVSGTLDSGEKIMPLEDTIESGPDNAPEAYRGLVAEYFKSLSGEL